MPAPGAHKKAYKLHCAGLEIVSWNYKPSLIICGVNRAVIIMFYNKNTSLNARKLQSSFISKHNKVGLKKTIKYLFFNILPSFWYRN